MSKIGIIRRSIREYGVHGAAVKAADRVLRRTPEEVPYERWQTKNRLSERDYAKMAREDLSYRPLIGVSVRAKGEDRLALVQSLNLQIYRVFRAMKDAPGAEYLLFIGTGCTLAPDLLWQCAKYLSENGSTGVDSYSDVDLIYFDSDVIGPDGRKGNPAFRPEYDPELIRSVNYMGEVFLVRASLAKEAGLPGSGPGEIHAFLKRICERENVPAGQERTGPVRHIPKVLYHVLEEDTRQTKAMHAEPDAGSGIQESAAEGEEKPLLSVLIPNRDHAEDLRRCVSSLLDMCADLNMEILILENNSREEGTRKLYRELTERDPRVRVETFEGAFNYSAINNFGARRAKGGYLLLLNNDTEVLDRSSIPQMMALAAREDVGAVGALLTYPGGIIQHGGIILGHGGIAGHAFQGEDPEETELPGKDMLLGAVHNVSAVTGACMMLRSEVFRKVGGFDEALAVTFNDVDLCLRIRQWGLHVLMCPAAHLTHYESLSRGAEDSPEKVERFHSEIRTFVHRWEKELREGDPFYSPNFTLTMRPYTCRDLRRESVPPYRRYLYL